jgi:integrase
MNAEWNDTPPSTEERTRNANGESSIYQDKAGGWHAWVTMGVKPDGSPDRRHRRGKTRKAVVAKAKVLERQRDSGEYAAAGGAQTVEQWLRHWIVYVQPARLRAKSLASYRTDVYLHLIPGLGAHRLQRLTALHIETLYATMRAKTVTAADGTQRKQYRPATIDHIHRTLRRALGDAKKRGLIAVNPATLVERPTEQTLDAEDTEIAPLSVADARAVIAAARTRRNGARYILALSHGLRQGEAIGLPWSRVHLDDDPRLVVRQQLQRHTWQHGCRPTEPAQGETWACGRKRGADCPTRHSGGLVLVRVKSKRSKRTLTLDDVTIDLLRAHRRDQMQERLAAGDQWDNHRDLVFTQPNGHPVDPRADLKEWHDLLDEAGVPEARLHDARHTAATFLLVQGVDSRVVMDLMGWSSHTMLARYEHVVRELRAEAARRMSAYLYGDGEAETG